MIERIHFYPRAVSMSAEPVPLVPLPDPPDESRVSRIVLTIGRKRFELLYRVEVREIKRLPADVLEISRSTARGEENAPRPRVTPGPAG